MTKRLFSRIVLALSASSDCELSHLSQLGDLKHAVCERLPECLVLKWIADFFRDFFRHDKGVSRELFQEIKKPDVNQVDKDVRVADILPKQHGIITRCCPKSAKG